MLGTGFGLGVRASISTNHSKAKRRPQAVWLAAAAAAAVTSLAAGTRALAATDTWSGASGIDNNWQTAGNWDTLPVAGDTLIFGGTTNLSSNNNFAAGTSFGAITFGTGAGAYQLSGNSIALTGALTDNAVRGVVNGVAKLYLAMRNRREVAALLAADPGMLRDLGLTPMDVSCALAEPVWRDPSARLLVWSIERRAAQRAQLRDNLAGLARDPVRGVSHENCC
jgi:uncharacterized protein YjiS (DUF1127 family)